MATAKGKESDDDYDPYEYRDLPHATNNFETMLHIMKGILGTGILALPDAFRCVGFIVGIPWCLVNIGIIMIGMHTLMNARYLVCKKKRVPLLTYSEAMGGCFEHGPESWKCFTKAGVIVVDVFIVAAQLGNCAVYILFVAISLKMVIDESLKNSISIEIYILMTFVPFVFINAFRNLKVLVPLSFLANAIIIITIAFSFYFIYQNGLNDLGGKLGVNYPKEIPIFFGITQFAFQSVPIIAAVDNNMKTAKSFGGLFGVYNRAMVVIVFLYLILGIFGYWSYGDHIKPSITLNFPAESILTKVINSSFALAIYISYGLNAIVPLMLLWDAYIYKIIEKTNWPISWEYLLRITEVIITILAAATIPMLGLVISLIGAVAVSCMGLIFPGIMDICARWPDSFGKYRIHFAKDIILIVYGMLGTLSGAYTTIAEIVNEFIARSKN